MRKALMILSFCCAIVMSADSYIDIPYYPAGTAPNPEKNLLDIYVPSGASNTPVFFWIHGGGWCIGDKDEYQLLGQNMADQEGYVAVIISYRLSDSLHPEVQHPDHIEDVARAFAWTKEHIFEYGGDPNRIFICGQSAGGHLTALLFSNTRFLEAESLTDNDIFGAMPISGIYNLWYYEISDTLASDMLQDAFGDDSATWNDASPILHLHYGMPPVRIFVAIEDPLNLRLEAAAFLNEMNIYQPTDTIFVDGTHISEVWDLMHTQDSRIRRQIVAFMEEVISTRVEEKQVFPEKFSLGAFPNPFNSSIEIRFQGFEVSRFQGLEIFDLNGKRVFKTPFISRSLSPQGERDDSQVGNVDDGQSLAPRGVPTGRDRERGSIIWTPDKSISSGLYSIRATMGDGQTITKRIMYLK